MLIVLRIVKINCNRQDVEDAKHTITIDENKPIIKQILEWIWLYTDFGWTYFSYKNYNFVNPSWN